MQDHLFPPPPLRLLQARPIIDVIAKNDEIWPQQRVVLRGRSVIELEPIRTIVHADVVCEGLVYVMELLELCRRSIRNAISALA
jgi:hypothetical protein